MRSGVCVCYGACVAWCVCVCSVRKYTHLCIMLFPCARVCMCQRIRVLWREGILTCEFNRLAPPCPCCLALRPAPAQPCSVSMYARSFSFIVCMCLGLAHFVSVYSRLSTCVCLLADTLDRVRYTHRGNNLPCSELPFSAAVECTHR